MRTDVHIVKVGPHQQDTVMYTDGVCRCICVGQHNNTNSYLNVLAPGVVNSLFGNSIVVDVMTEMFRELFYEDRKPKEEITLF